MLLLTLRETYALNMQALQFQKPIDERAANLTTALGGQRSCYATVCASILQCICSAGLSDDHH